MKEDCFDQGMDKLPITKVVICVIQKPVNLMLQKRFGRRSMKYCVSPFLLNNYVIFVSPQSSDFIIFHCIFGQGE